MNTKLKAPAADQTPKRIELKATKIAVRKTGMNSGIVGGGYQCC